MKRLVLTSIVLVAILSLYGVRPLIPVVASSDTPLGKALVKQIDGILTDYMKSDNHAPGIAVTVILYAGDATTPQISEFFYGTTKKGSKQFPNASTIFGLGSESKVFTAVLLAALVKEGKVKLSDPIQKYLPADVKAPTFEGKEITLVDLATHRSGLPDSPDNKGGKNKIDPNQYTKQDLYDWLNSYKLTRAPGSKWEYSNIGFGLLGTLLMGITNQSYDDLMAKYLGQPLNMPDTVVFLSDEQLTRAAQGYDGKGQPAELMTTRSSTEVIGGGQLSSTIHDMEAFMEANLDEVGDPAVLQYFDLTHKIAADGAGDNAKMGLGWQIAMPANANKGFPRYWKDGAASGFHTFMTFIKDKDSKAAVAMLGNGIDTGSGYEQIGVKILKLVSGN